MADKLKSLPKVPRELRGPGRLPLPENLIKKTPEELLRTLNRFGIEPDIHAIDQRARRAFLRLERIIAEGVEPDEATWKSIAEQHEKEMRETLRLMTKQAIRLYRQNKLTEGGGALIWITSGLSNVCPSCEKRHGKIKSKKQWTSLGLPGSSALICQSNCNCELLPAGDGN